VSITKVGGLKERIAEHHMDFEHLGGPIAGAVDVRPRAKHKVEFGRADCGHGGLRSRNGFRVGRRRAGALRAAARSKDRDEPPGCGFRLQPPSRSYDRAGGPGVVKES
jgi:hypothetical protein